MTRAIGTVMGSAFPWHTLGVNLLGAFLIGGLAEFMALKVSGVEPFRLLLVTGFFGGFTTFSAFSLENALMLQRGEYFSLLAYIGMSVLGTLAAVLIGGAAVKAVF